MSAHVMHIHCCFSHELLVAKCENNTVLNEVYRAVLIPVSEILSQEGAEGRVLWGQSVQTSFTTTCCCLPNHKLTLSFGR